MCRRYSLILIVLLLGASSLQAQVIVRQPWYETKITPTSLTLRWNTSIEARCTTFVTDSLRGKQSFAVSDGFIHSATFDDLDPASVLTMRIYASAGALEDTVDFISSTASERSTGEIRVLFNRSVDSTLPFERANGNADLLRTLRDRIDSARHSIDLAIYSFSGYTANAVAKSLREARERGVRVRVIADSASVANSTAFAGLIASGIPAIRNSFGGNGDTRKNIHHNKFALFDARKGGSHSFDPRAVWLMTGSWNLSDRQTTTDAQNVIYLQDETVAEAYLREFEEEWGSNSDEPNALVSRFSTHKLSNTARSFSVGGERVHAMFSPSDGVAASITSYLERVNASLCFSIYAFTRNDLAESIASLAPPVRSNIHGLIGTSDANSRALLLRTAAVDVLDWPLSDSVSLHHKYAVLDAGHPTAAVITGSYNWSGNAEERNDENTLILECRDVAGAYLQEWLARYREAGGTASIALPTLREKPSASSFTMRLIKTPERSIVKWFQRSTGIAKVRLADVVGRTVFYGSLETEAGESSLDIPIALRAGVYVIAVDHDEMREALRFPVVR